MLGHIRFDFIPPLPSRRIFLPLVSVKLGGICKTSGNSTWRSPQTVRFFSVPPYPYVSVRTCTFPHPQASSTGDKREACYGLDTMQARQSASELQSLNNQGHCCESDTNPNPQIRVYLLMSQNVFFRHSWLKSAGLRLEESPPKCKNWKTSLKRACRSGRSCP